MVPSITTAGISSVSESRGSLAGGIIYMFQLVGGAFGLAVVTTIFTDFAKDDLLTRLQDSSLKLSNTELSEVVNFVIGSGSSQTILNSLGQQEYNTVFNHIHHAYVTGVSSGLVFTAIFCGLGALLTILFVKNKGALSNP